MASPRGLKDLISGFQQAGGTDAILKAIERKRQERSFAELMDKLQNQSQTKTVEETQQINNPLAQGITNPLMKYLSQAFNPVKDITTQREVPLPPQEYNKNLTMEIVKAMGSVDPQKLQMLFGAFKQDQPNYGVSEVGNNLVRYDKNNPTSATEIYKGTPKIEKQKDVSIHYETLKNEKGKPIRYKIVSDPLTGQTLSKEPQGEPDKVEGITLNNYAGDRLEFDKEKEIAKQKEKDAKGQGTYDAIMDSWDNEAKAYVVNKGSKDEQKFKTDEEVQRFAQKIIESEGYMNVKKWKHAKGGQTPKTGKQSSNYIEGKIYVDANGNKAKYVNGEFIEVK